VRITLILNLLVVLDIVKKRSNTREELLYGGKNILLDTQCQITISKVVGVIL